MRWRTERCENIRNTRRNMRRGESSPDFHNLFGSRSLFNHKTATNQSLFIIHNFQNSSRRSTTCCATFQSGLWHLIFFRCDDGSHWWKKNFFSVAALNFPIFTQSTATFEQISTHHRSVQPAQRVLLCTHYFHVQTCWMIMDFLKPFKNCSYCYEYVNRSVSYKSTNSTDWIEKQMKGPRRSLNLRWGTQRYAPSEFEFNDFCCCYVGRIIAQHRFVDLTKCLKHFKVQQRI